MTDGGGNVIGYSRVSKGEHNPELQHGLAAALVAGPP